MEFFNKIPVMDRTALRELKKSIDFSFKEFSRAYGDAIEGLRIADFISLHMPLTNKTKNMIAKNEFELMKKNSIIVNTSRGGIINENDLEYALKNNLILGAGLDVYEKEPPEDSNPLFDLNNIILTPHNAALTIECQKRMAIETCENIAFFLEDKKNLNNSNILNLNN